MRVICERRCQVRIKGKIVTVNENQVMELDCDKAPEHFHEIGAAVKKGKKSEVNGVDFDAISREELIEIDGDVDDLKKYVHSKYPEVQFANNIGWDTLVFRYLEARENRVLTIDNTGKVKNTTVNVQVALKESENENSDADEDDDTGDGDTGDGDTGNDDLDKILNA